MATEHENAASSENRAPPPPQCEAVAFAHRHDIAVGEAREFLRQAGRNTERADMLAYRSKKW